MYHTVIRTTAKTVTIKTPRCIVCLQYGEVELPLGGYNKWQAGAFIQNAMPEISAGLREQCITGIHPECWTAAGLDDDEEA